MQSRLREKSFLEEFFRLPGGLRVPVAEEHVADPDGRVVEEALDPRNPETQDVLCLRHEFFVLSLLIDLAQLVMQGGIKAHAVIVLYIAAEKLKILGIQRY